MLRNNGLYDPIKRTEDMSLDDFNRYISIYDIARQMNKGASAKIVQTIYESFFESHPNVPKEALTEIWETILPRLERNPALAKFIVDYNAAHSKYFFPWLMTVDKSPATALEMAYGAGYDLTNHWAIRTDNEDEIEKFICNVPTFVYNRERQLTVADLATTVQKKGSKEKPTKIVDLGAGRMAWARWHGFMFNPEKQSVIAFERDSSIDAHRLFSRMPEQLGVTYHVADMSAAFADPESRDADMVILGGVASYIPINALGKTVFLPVHSLLKPGGVFFFDLQLQCPQYEWTVKLFDWPAMVLMNSPEEAIKNVEEIRRNLWRGGIKFSAEYKLDTYNEAPSALMITFTRI